MAERSGVAEPLGRVVEACHDAFANEAAELRSHLLDGIVAALRSGLVRHHEALGAEDLQGLSLPAEADASAEVPESNAAESAPEQPAGVEAEATSDEDGETLSPEALEALLAYRHVVMSELLEPLGTQLAPGPFRTLSESFLAAAGAAADACRALPETVQIEWAADAFRPKASDRRFRRWGKLLARLLGGARKAGKTRPVPLRAVAKHHLIAVVGPAQASARLRRMRAWAQWMTRLEVVLVDWANEALTPLASLEAMDDEVGLDVAGAIIAAGMELEEGLQALADEAPVDFEVEEATARFGASAAILADDLSLAGSFVFRPADPGAVKLDLRKLKAASARLVTQEERFEARVKMYFAMLALLTGMRDVRDRLIDGFREEGLPAAQALLEIADELEAMVPALEATSGAQSTIAKVAEEVTPVVGRAVSLVPSVAEMEPVVSARAVQMVDTWYAMLRHMPPSLVLNSADGLRKGRTRRIEGRTIPLQEFVGQSFDALRMERARAAAARLTTTLEQLRHAVEELPEALAYARESAESELAAGRESESWAEALVTDAVRNVTESLRSAVRDANLVIQEVRRALARETREGVTSLLERIDAGLMQAQLLRAQSGVARARIWINETWGPPVERAARWLLRRLLRLRRIATRGLRRGAELVSGATGEQSESARAVKLLAESEAVMSRLPLVYQRLFAFEPVSDPALLAGRRSEMADLTARWDRWQAGDGVPVIVKGLQGIGISSLLDVFATQIETQGERVARVTLDERISSEPELVTILTGAFGLDGVTTMDEVAGALFQESELPRLVVIDNLEHLYLRVPGGTDLMERMLTLMSEAEPRTLMIGGVAASAWQLVSTAEPTAVSQVAAVDLAPLSPSGVRDAITIRYRRSGLPVRFEEPADARSTLRRRLRRARTAEAKRKVLEDEFFEQLQRASGQNLRVAFFQCLRSSDFGVGEGVLMRPPVRPDFTVLDSLTLTQNFTLKAFLEHRTLTLEEHDRIFRVERQESYQIFESLGNRHLITPVARPTGPDIDRSRIVEGVRYKVQPLLTGAVIAHLGARNIVH